MPRSAYAADNGLCARPAGVNQNAHHGVAQGRLLLVHPLGIAPLIPTRMRLVLNILVSTDLTV